MTATTTSATPDATHLANRNTEALSATFKNPTSFKLLYFPIHSNGATTREILSIAQAEWETLVPTDWEKEKEKTPFNVLPVLFISSPTNNDAVLAEAGVIEQYIAKQFDLMGSNVYEENLIKSFNSSIASLHQMHATTVASISDKEARKKAMELTLADIRTSNLIEHLLLQTGGEHLINIVDRNPSLRRLWIEVGHDPRVNRWRTSKSYETLTTATDLYFSDPFAPAPKL
ncbi:hypothetical protein BGZ97_009275 [Linnemannia gamsii]|uniref:GST N-terminal domain-containing protein n=1 Tax=Linnemannia gamsii TaxID=64522 RepID=A0A9P6UEB6_9FUNG|nr:hypothetical protein BGZ97_009275 [Linnemannia gamsii]